MTAEATPGGLTTLVYSSLQVTWEPNSGRIVHPASHDAINEWNLVFFLKQNKPICFSNSIPGMFWRHFKQCDL